MSTDSLPPSPLNHPIISGRGAAEIIEFLEQSNTKIAKRMTPFRTRSAVEGGGDMQPINCDDYVVINGYPYMFLFFTIITVQLLNRFIQF